MARIVEHVREAEDAYVDRLGWWSISGRGSRKALGLESVRDEALRGLQAAVLGQIPEKGPRGGRRWLPRYFVRRVAWHVLDHAWEIEDRLR